MYMARKALLVGDRTDRDDLRDFTFRIYDKTQGFVGRQFVFEALDGFLRPS
jgi:hypothetical protein